MSMRHRTKAGSQNICKLNEQHDTHKCKTYGDPATQTACGSNNGRSRAGRARGRPVTGWGRRRRPWRSRPEGHKTWDPGVGWRPGRRRWWSPRRALVQLSSGTSWGPQGPPSRGRPRTHSLPKVKKLSKSSFPIGTTMNTHHWHGAVVVVVVVVMMALRQREWWGIFSTCDLLPK